MFNVFSSCFIFMKIIKNLDNILNIQLLYLSVNEINHLYETIKYKPENFRKTENYKF